MTATIRWGILGTGQIARSFASALRDVPGTVLQAVGSRNGDTAQAFATEFNSHSHYGSYGELASDAQVDVVYIATPHTLHAENTRMCLLAGKPVLCEKPFTVNRQQAREVIALARQKNLFLMEAMWSRTLPAIREAKRLLEDGAIGIPRQLQADFGYAADVDPNHRLRDRQLAGGALLDLGIYPLSLAAYLLGEIEVAQAQAELGCTGVDEQTVFTLRHRGGALSSCLCSINADSPLTLTVSGSAGQLRVHAPFFHAQEFSIVGRDGTSRNVQRPSIGNGYAHEAIEVGRCLQHNLTESPLMPLDETLALMACMDTMRAQCGVRYPADDETAK
jgi:predicted dehydrogenase